jgi:hypothetical protein
LPPSAIVSDVENGSDFILFFSSDFNRRRRRDDSVRNGVGMEGFKEGDVEDGMNPAHGSGKVEFSGVRTDFGEDGEGTEPLCTQFLGRPLGLDVLGAKPDLRTDSESGRGGSELVGSDLILGLSGGDLLFDVGMELRK